MLHSACIWKHRHSHSAHLSERVGRGKLIVQSPFRLPSPFSKPANSSYAGRSSRDPWICSKIWHPLCLWSDEFPSFHPRPSLCWSSLKSSSVPHRPKHPLFPPTPTQNQVISLQAGPHFTPRVCLSGLDGVVAVAYVSLLGGQRCKGGRGAEEESIKNTGREIWTGVKWTAGRAKNLLSCKFGRLLVPWS